MHTNHSFAPSRPRRATPFLILILLTTAPLLRADVLWAWNLSGNGAGSLSSTTTAGNLFDAVLTYDNPGNLESDTLTGLTITGQSSLTLRIYGWNSISEVANWGLFSSTFSPGGPDELVINGSVAVVPEPSSRVLLGVGLFALTSLRRKPATDQ